MNGVCALCRQERKLIEAHVIPKSFHRLDHTDPRPAKLLTNEPGRYTQKVPKGIYDPTIVCEACERRFSAWDDYADELFLKRWCDFTPLRHAGQTVGYTLPQYDYHRLKLFFISLLWSASVSSHTMFSKVTAGPHEETLRKAILESDPGNEHFYATLLQAFDSTEIGMLNPLPERLNGQKYYRFYLGHIIAWIKADSRPLSQDLEIAALKQDQALITTSKSFQSSPERRIMRNLVLAAHNRTR